MNKLKPRILLGSVFCLTGIFVALGEAGLSFEQSKARTVVRGSAAPAANAPGEPDVVRLVGPIVSNIRVRDLPYIPPAPQILEEPLTRYRHSERPTRSQSSSFPRFQSLSEKILPPAPSMPLPLLTFEGINYAQTKCDFLCDPPDTNGDVGPNHYVQAVNTSFRVFDKSGNPLTPVTTFNSFFAPLGGGNPCGNHQNHGDPFVFYDHIADRWVITDFALVPEFVLGMHWCVSDRRPYGHLLSLRLATRPDEPNAIRRLSQVCAVAGRLLPDHELVYRPHSQQGLRRRPCLCARPRQHDQRWTRECNRVHDPVRWRGLFLQSRSCIVSYWAAHHLLGNTNFYSPLIQHIPGAALTQIHGWYFHVDFMNPANSTIGRWPRPHSERRDHS